MTVGISSLSLTVIRRRFQDNAIPSYTPAFLGFPESHLDCDEHPYVRPHCKIHNEHNRIRRFASEARHESNSRDGQDEGNQGPIHALHDPSAASETPI